MNDILAWDRQPDETTLAYNAFCLYRDMGLVRSLEKTRIKMGKDSAGYIRQLETWSKRYSWVARAQAWDTHQQALLDARVAEQKAQLIDDELTDYRAQMTKWREVFAQTKMHMKTNTQKLPDGSPVQLVELNTSDWFTLSKWRTSIADLGRRALGMPDQIQQQQHTGKDGGELLIQFEWVDDEGDNGGH